MSNQQANQSVPKRNGGLDVAENVLIHDNVFSDGYGIIAQKVMRHHTISRDARLLYSYLCSFAGAGDTAFPATKTILFELGFSPKTFYKYRDELAAFGLVQVETRNTRHGRQTVYRLPPVPMPSDEVHEIIRKRQETRDNRAANLPNKHVDNFADEKDCGKPAIDGYAQTAGREPRDQDGNMAKPSYQDGKHPCYQDGTMLNIVKSNKGKASIDLSEELAGSIVENSGSVGSRTADDPGRDTQVDALASLTERRQAPIDTLAGSLRNFSMGVGESRAFDELCKMSIKEPNPKREAQAQQLFVKRLREGYLPTQVLAAYDRYSQEYKETNGTPRFAMQLDDWLRKESGFKFYAGKPRAKASGGDAAERDRQAKRQRLLESDPEFKALCNRTTSLFSDWQVAQVGGLSTADGYHERWEAAKKAEEDYLAANGE